MSNLVSLIGRIKLIYISSMSFDLESRRLVIDLVGVPINGEMPAEPEQVYFECVSSLKYELYEIEDDCYNSVVGIDYFGEGKYVVATEKYEVQLLAKRCSLCEVVQNSI